jgi:SM-20-related protein
VSVTSLADPNIFAQASGLLFRQGWGVIENFLPLDTVAGLARESRQLDLRQAGVGRPRIVNNDIRGDHILWLTPPHVSTLQQTCLDHFEQLRLTLNQDLQLGLFEFEGHFAHYPVGAFYRKHLDSFQQENRRIVSCILYLNQDWQEPQGGQLRLYTGSKKHVDVLPQAGTLVVFFSDQFWHEVLPANRDRLSITGWFKERG